MKFPNFLCDSFTFYSFTYASGKQILIRSSNRFENHLILQHKGK